ncbi:MAG TPA: dihydroxyacetone kinase subunit DhaL [Actinomycetota bacterium]|nr:dihydroxyacetone kinase subunit DhaL [Actinomycetota bacterium]
MPGHDLEALDGGFVVRWVRTYEALLDENRDYLTQLDAAIGDADHGINMHRGFAAAVRELDGGPVGPPGRLLQAVGRVLVLTVGGAAGPLYGTAFRQAGASLGDAASFDPAALLAALRAGLEGIQRLGAAAEGDKTIVDAFAPALGALQRGLWAGAGLGEAVRRAREAAEEGMRATIPLQARKGRASYLGPRSVGHQDPGATSTALLFRALEGAVEEGASP